MICNRNASAGSETEERAKSEPARPGHAISSSVSIASSNIHNRSNIQLTTLNLASSVSIMSIHTIRVIAIIRNSACAGACDKQTHYTSEEEEKTWDDELREHQIVGRRAVSLSLSLYIYIYDLCYTYIYIYIYIHI